jgi:alkylglycerol monooxygenase
LVGTAIFLNKADQFSLSQKIFVTTLICIVVVNSGVLFEQRTWAKHSEWIRIILYPLLLAALTYMNGWSNLLYILACAYFIISITWFYAIQRRNVYIQMV